MTDTTSQYYEKNAREYFDRTVNVDMSHLYSQFLELIPEGGRILDAGCGSGRDLLAFSEKGYKVLGIDASNALIKMAERHSGATCMVKGLEDIDFEESFDGVWACASLLHIEREILPRVINNIHRALVPGGVFFASVQKGKGTRTEDDGRFYTLFGLDEFSGMLENSGFSVTTKWTSEDVLPGREALTWLNYLAQKPRK